MPDHNQPASAVDDWLTLVDLAERLDLEVSQVRRLVQERRLIGVRRAGVLSIPAAFVVPGHLENPAQPGDPQTAPRWAVLASLHGTVTVLSDAGLDDAETIEWLFTVDDQLGSSPIEALRSGRKTEVRRRASLEL